MTRFVELRSDGQHFCTSCEMLKSVADFYVKDSGLPQRHTCKSCICTIAKAKRLARGWRKHVRTPEDFAKRHADNLQRLRAWVAAHPERAKERRKAASQRFWERSPERVLARTNLRRARSKHAISEGCENWIVAIYEVAQGLGLTVDHVIPLNGKQVSGLHVPWNMQLLSKSRNSAKRNLMAA